MLRRYLVSVARRWVTDSWRLAIVWELRMRERWLSRLIRVGSTFLGWVALISGGYCIGMGGLGLSYVSPSTGHIWPTTAPNAMWFFTICVVGAGLAFLLLSASKQNSRCVVSLSIVCGALLFLGSAAFFAWFAAQFSLPATRSLCAFPNCWPYGILQFWLTAPTILVGCGALLCAVFWGRVSRGISLILLEGTWLVLSIVQLGVWDSLV